MNGIYFAASSIAREVFGEARVVGSDKGAGVWRT